MSSAILQRFLKVLVLTSRSTAVVLLVVSLSGAVYGARTGTASNSSNNSGNSNSSGNSASQAEAECEEAISMVQGSCAAAGMGSQGLNAAQQQYSQNLQNQSQQNGQSLQGQQGQQSGQAKACKKAADISGIVGALSGLMGGACLFAVSSCREACGAQSHEQTVADSSVINQAARDHGGDATMPPFEANREYSANRTVQTARMKRLQKTCAAYAPGAMGAFAQAAAGLASMLMAGQCDQQAATAQQTPAPLAGTAQDCNNPQFAATNITCICQKDPKSSYCQKAADMPSGLGYTAASGGPLGPGTGNNGPISDGAPIGGLDGQAKSASGSQEMGGGGGGGGFGGGKGASALAANGDGGGDPRSSVPTGIIQGTSGGSASGAGGGGPGGGGGGGRGGGGPGRGNNDGFNIRDFLPKSASRNIAGMSISAKDGVTGPLGPSIFEKVTKQYQFQRRNMIQDR